MDPVVVIDFETAGLAPDMGDRTTEFAVLVRDCRFVDQCQRLVNSRRRIVPFTQYPIRISKTMVREAPSANLVMSEVSDFVGDYGGTTRGSASVQSRSGVFARRHWLWRFTPAAAAESRREGARTICGCCSSLLQRHDARASTIRTIRGCLATIIVALSLVSQPIQAAEPPGASTPPVLAPTTEASAPAESPERTRRMALVNTHGAKIADAILAGVVLKAMTMEQVTLARGEPLRTEVIPPDSALWYYADGEVAFADGKASYVDLQGPLVRDTPAGQSNARPAPTPLEDQQVAETPSRRDTANVNTPGDGFLALRSEPSIRRGKRLLKIPHNTMLTLDECVTSEADGRWCRTGFQGEVGWVFERYLVR